MNNKMGRPPLPKGYSKNIQIGVRFNTKEAKKIDKAIEASGSAQTKAEWLRDMAKFITADSVVCRDFTVKDLDGKTACFRIRMESLEPVEGSGRIIALQRGDGTLKVQIESQYINDDPNSFYRFTMPQAAVPWIRKMPAGSGCDFEIIDPSIC